MTAPVSINPSVLNSDFMRIGEELDRIADADRAHIDVMDNHFVPNLTFGPSMVEQMARRSPIPLDAHLMIADADRHAVAYAEAGAESVTFHLEAAQAPVRLARELHRAGAKVGVALRPATPVDPLLDILAEFDMVLVMTVEPGFGGQSFLPSMLPKIRRVREAAGTAGLELSVQVDGGINRTTIEQAAEAGADVFVAGSAIYTADDAAAEIGALREIAARHLHV
ncbi:ribulose-phosphate 3-epimerase [Brachybacterium huguangmaarense]|uniref:Ribulose-phosphate 3-epimerase n=1 Tax=Brachybacterium huguangmaarense TaxID=1652028 RepID=A0ABY6G0W5_9MICO|nr:ribulose-phosphate 3-epimerase [Brachybacterium huguangmaarense]UYG16309.1 ribulose-phosphate 3-epimerase [Brachybacterium huguangmaarense]